MEAPIEKEAGAAQQPLAMINAIAGELAVTQHLLRVTLQALGQSRQRTVLGTARDTLEAGCAKQLGLSKVPDAFLAGVEAAAQVFGLRPPREATAD